MFDQWNSRIGFTTLRLSLCAVRNGLDLDAVAHVHAAAVYLMVGLTVAALAVLRRVGAPAAAQRAVRWLLALEVAQGVVGYVQFTTGLPELLVGLHLLGAALIVAAATRLVVTTRDRPSAPAAPRASLAPQSGPADA